MDYSTRKRKPNPPSSPLPNPITTFSIFKDISNFKTPNKQPSKPLNYNPPPTPQFFTASRTTTATSVRRAKPPSALKSKTVRRLKAFELEQTKSARKLQNEKEKSLKSLSRSLSVWLNFLFENPNSCGCEPVSLIDGGSDLGETKLVLGSNGKRASGVGSGVGIDGPWRGTKRQKGVEVEKETGLSDFKFLGLKSSLKEICSFEDLKERMRMYLSLDACSDVFESMSTLTKNIDGGRIKMRISCPIVSDVRMKEKAIRILMSYNPIWLRIGLYIILGGESLFPDGETNSDQETAFLRMVIEKQFLTHTDLAKAYAYNKMVEGLYRPGYYEKLGNVILKRFFLLVIILDRAKAYTCLPLKYGIDGLDGGSPLLFSSNCNIKSGRQLVTEFLSSEVMHGEGNVIAHLAIVGYKVNYQQNPLIEYDFNITDLFDDLQDGVRLCRAIQLLTHDSSILMKMLVPADTRKKSLANCGIALQYLKQAGTPLVDEDETEIIAEDLVNGDKELILALLWNMFVHLQLPLLLDRSILSEEISNIQGVAAECSSTKSLLDLLLSWIQAVCGTYDLKVQNQSSLLDGKAMWCLLDYYFRKEQDGSSSFKDSDGTKREVSIMSAIEYTDAVHNFLLTQKLTSLLGNFPEVLQVSDILVHNGACNAQTVIVLLVFLSVQLLVKRNVDKLNFHKLLGYCCQNPSARRLSTERNTEQDGTRDFKVVMAWWQDMAQQNGKGISTQPIFTVDRTSSNIQRENAATIIQSHFKRFVKRRDYLRVIDATLVLQSAALALLTVKKKINLKYLRSRSCQGLLSSKKKHAEKLGTYITFLKDRHYFVSLKNSTIAIQRATRAWIYRRHCNQIWLEQAKKDRIIGVQEEAAILIQHSWREFVFSKSTLSQHLAASHIQSYYRGWMMRKSFQVKKEAIIKMQSCVRCLKSKRNLQTLRIKNMSAIVIQSHYRGWLIRKSFASKKQAILNIQRSFRCLIIRRNSQVLTVESKSALVIQSHYRGWLIRKSFASKKQAILNIQRSFRCLIIRRNFQVLRVESKSALVVQSHYRGWLIRKSFASKKQAILNIQRCFRCLIIRRNFQVLRVENNSALVIQSHLRGWLIRKSFASKRQAIINIQRSFRCLIIGRNFQVLRVENKSALIIQSHLRGWLMRKRFESKKQAIIKIQSSFRCLKTRKNIQILGMKNMSALVIQSHFRGWSTRREAHREKRVFIAMQNFCRGWLQRKELLIQHDCATRIQNAFHCMNVHKAFISQRQAAIDVQRFIRGENTRKRLLGADSSGVCCHNTLKDSSKGLEIKILLQSVVKLQRKWRQYLFFKTKSVIVIQSHVRGWMGRKMANREKKSVIVIQSYWKGYIARKNARGQLLDLRLRMQKSAANIDDNKRLINRLVAAVSELLNMRSVSGILHTCATLDVATELSQKCCEALVEAGAVVTLLKLIRSVSRSIPDQQVLKHALSTLRNLARYQHLTEILIKNNGCVETIFMEFLRNKEEGYFIASDLLKKICACEKGRKIMCSPAILKRLKALVEELTRKAGNEKRNARNLPTREQMDRRLKEAVELLHLIKS